MTPWIRDSVMMWLCEDLALWKHGSTNIWLCEDIVLLRYGSVKTSWLCEDVACLSRLRTWVLISKTHTKLDGIGSIYNASTPKGRWWEDGIHWFFFKLFSHLKLSTPWSLLWLTNHLSHRLVARSMVSQLVTLSLISTHQGHSSHNW